MPPTVVRTRRLTTAEYEAALASLALAGMRIILQDTASALANTHTKYTVQNTKTRRVCMLHTATGATDLTFAYNRDATANDMPFLPQHYVFLDAGYDSSSGVFDYISIYNNTGSPITVNFMEVA